MQLGQLKCLIEHTNERRYLGISSASLLVLLDPSEMSDTINHDILLGAPIGFGGEQHGAGGLLFDLKAT